MKTVTIHEAKTHLSRILHEVESGETVVVARGKTPIARLVPYSNAERAFDTAPGLIVAMADDFDEPMDDFGPYMAAEQPE
ncbi:MAG: type II toxin-antitoxin system Phd/YefM family antitoxin [bacterium]